MWAPIDVRLLDASGDVVAETNVEGADPALVHVPFVPAGGTSFYVNDLIAWVRKRFQRVSLLKSLIQVTLGGAVVIAIGVALGTA